jgi:hypothetical protein
LIRLRKLLRSPHNSVPGFTLTAHTAHSELSQLRTNFPASIVPIRFLSILTNGFTNLSIAVVCCTVTPTRRDERSPYSGDYVRTLNNDPVESFAFFDESIELSRRFRALKLWFSLRYHGLAAFRKAIENDLQHAQRLGSLIEETPDLRLMAPIELSAVCFRYVRDVHTENNLNRLNSEILRRIVERGNVYLSNATLQSRFCLRACVMNHRTTNSDIDRVVAEVLAVAKEVDNAN